MHRIVIKPTVDRLYLTDRLSLPWSATNLPAEAFRLREREDFYWEAEMVAYETSTGLLRLRVVDFEAEEEDYLPDRPAKAEVLRVEFAPLDRHGFCAQLSFYRPERLPLTDGVEPAAVPKTFPDPALSLSIEPASPPRELSFTVPFTELRVRDGYVEGTFAPEEWLSLPFRIPNPHLVKEFDVILPYFSRQLRRRTVEVQAELHFDGKGEGSIRYARSPQIARIDERLIEVLRARTLRQFLRQEDPDKTLFTPEELWERSADDDPVRALLPPPGRELLEEILREGNVRNAHQLAYLAERHERGQKLRFVLSPQFGFFFFVRGEGMHHFVLELLDSHATYIWSLPREAGTLTVHFRLVKREVEQLNAIGRQGYRRANTFAYTFWSVRHDQVGSEFVDGFPRWRARLEEGLV